MNRRDMLIATGTAAVSLSKFPLGYAAPAGGKKRRLLFFTKSVTFEHSVVKRKNGQLGHAEQILTDLGKKHNFEVTCTKDGRVFAPGKIDDYDAILFYTTGDLTQKASDGSPPMPPGGKQLLLDAVRNGKGFVGLHCASDSFHTPGDAHKNQKNPDPYLAMVGGEFISHGKQQVARMTVTSPNFPGLEKAGDGFDLHEEWYALKNFAPDMHVILREEAYGVEGWQYMRPAYPATWARMHGKGRVFYTSMGHREDVWTNDIFQSILLGGIAWACRNVDADIPPNLKAVTPYCAVLAKPKKA